MNVTPLGQRHQSGYDWRPGAFGIHAIISCYHEGSPMRSREVDYQIYGQEMQLVEVELDPEEAVIAEAGSMTYMEAGIEFETKLGDGSDPDQGFFGKM